MRPCGKRELGCDAAAAWDGDAECGLLFEYDVGRECPGGDHSGAVVVAAQSAVAGEPERVGVAVGGNAGGESHAQAVQLLAGDLVDAERVQLRVGAAEQDGEREVVP